MTQPKLTSYWRKLIISLTRNWDQLLRHVTGLPVAKSSQITDSLFLGGQYSLNKFTSLKKWGITAIVNMRTHSVHSLPFTDFSYLHLPTQDNTAPSLADLLRGIDFISTQIEAGGKVYIHCRLGEGRGPTMVLAYLLSTGLNLEDALEVVHKVRPFISPTQVQLNGLKELAQYYKKLNRS